MNELSYRMESGYRLPNLLPPDEPEVTLGKYALLRRRFLREQRRVTFTNLLTTEQEALNRLEVITAQMARAEGVTETLKATDQMTWVQRMNSIRQRAEETILTELIYS